MKNEEAARADGPTPTADREFSLAWLDGFVTAISQRIAAIGVAGILVVALLTVVDVVLRWGFHVTLFGLNEASALLIAVGVTACLPAGIARRVPLTIELATLRLSAPAAGWFRLLGACGLLVFLVILAWRVWLVAEASQLANDTTVLTDLPIAPFFFGVSIGLFVCVVIQAVILLRAAVEAQQGSASNGVVPLVAILGTTAVTLAAAFGMIDVSALAGLLPSGRVALVGAIFLVMWVIALATVPLGAAMGLAGLIGTAMMLGREPALSVMGSDVKNYLTQPSLSVLPLFLLMGTFAGLSGIGSDLYRLAHALFGHRPGGLANATIAGCAGFGALTGSSMATQMTIGRIAMPEMEKRGYSQALSAGAMAAGGTLGALIPPSAAMIVYCVLAEESVGRMFMGAILPGILATLLYMATVSAWVRIQPGAAPASPRASSHEVIEAFRSCWAALLLLGIVLGGIYSGIFTELEAGSVGVVGAFILSIVRRRLTLASLWHVMGETTATIALMYTLLFGVAMLSFMFGIAGLPQFFIGLANSFNLTPLGVVLALIFVYLLLGTAMDSWTMMVITIPIFVPLVVSFGYDPIWFGMIVIICMEAGQISPPFGLNIFIMKSIAPQISLSTVYRGCWPFVGSTLVKIALLVAFPIIVTWLPSTM